MKNFIKLFTLAISLAVLGSACQKEEQNAEPQQNETREVFAEKSYPQKKGPIYQRPGSVVVKNDMGELSIVHSTKKVKGTNLLQEWLYVDLHSPAFWSYSNQPNDPDGITNGYYYEWLPNFGDMTQTDWNDYVDESGFHIPTLDDINRLAAALGSTSKIRKFLNLDYDGTSLNYTNGQANMWVQLNGAYPGCGVIGQWRSSESDNFYYVFTNIPTLGVNVRLVRNITLEQWNQQ
jgi:hypothetical protein